MARLSSMYSNSLRGDEYHVTAGNMGNVDCTQPIRHAVSFNYSCNSNSIVNSKFFCFGFNRDASWTVSDN